MNPNINIYLRASSFLILHIILLSSPNTNCLDNASEFIDLKQPIVIIDKQQQDNYVSYSIAAFESQNGQSKVYFGAPKSNHKYNATKSVDSGVVLECGLQLGEFSESIQCKTLKLSETGAPAQCRSKQTCGSIKGIPNEAWIGGTLSTSSSPTGNQLVTCGHRWQTRDLFSKSWTVSGMCYRLSASDLQSGNGKTLTSNVLEPPLDKANLIKTVLTKKTELKKTTSVHLWHYGQFGFSSAFDNFSGQLLVGAPGYFGWSGGVVLYPDSGNWEISSINTKNVWPQLGLLPDFNDNTAPYLGYAMTTGKYFRSGESIFAAGAPRATNSGGSTHLIGTVTFLKTISNVIKEIEYYTVFGNQLGSYFGSVLASADINNDGLDELIVGAPYYNLQTIVDSYDEGCAFVYRFTSKTGVIRVDDIDQLCPSTEPGGRFGFAIANLGDINQDSYQDIAISAPMAGKVYIYLGSPDKLSPSNPLRFSAKEFNREINGFGSYLYGNVDLDGNGTPDLIIGSFVSKQALILRTRPKLEFHLTFPHNHNIQKFKRDDKDFDIRYCIRATCKPNNCSRNSTMEIHMEVIADADRSDNSARFTFEKNGQRSLQFPIKVDVDNKCNYAPLRVLLSKALAPKDSKRITFKWQLHYNETKHFAVTNNTFEITDTQGKETRLRGSGNFCPSCPAPTTSEEILFTIPLANDTCDSDNNPVCNSNLKIFTQLTDKNDSAISNSILGSTEQRVLKIVVKNSGETAYSPMINLTIYFPSEEIAKQVIKTLRTSDCSQNSSETQDALKRFEFKTTCLSRDPLHTGESWSISYRMDFGGLNALQKPQEMRLEIKAYPEADQEQATTSDFKMKLISEFDLIISGDNQNEILDFNLKNSPPFGNSYQLLNHGISPLSLILLEFNIPMKRNIDGKYETVIQIAEPKHQGLLCESTEMFERFVEASRQKEKPSFNGSIDSISPVSVSRKRRATVKETEDNANDKPNGVVKEKLSTKSDSTYKKIGCGLSDWKCATLTCQVMYPLSQNNPLTINLQLKIINRFAKKLFGEKADRIVVKTDGQAKIFESEEFTKMASSQTEFTIIKDSGLPALVIFGSAIGGLILFGLITLGLFKCGFFRRKTKEELEAMKAREEEQKMLAETFPMPSDDPENE